MLPSSNDAVVLRALRAEAHKLLASRAPLGLTILDLAHDGWIAYQQALPRAISYPHAYAMTRARGAMLDALRKWCDRPKSQPSFFVDWNPVFEPVNPEYEHDGLEELRESLRTLLWKLTVREYTVLRRIYVELDNAATIAAELGCSVQSIWLTRHRAVKRLRTLAAS